MYYQIYEDKTTYLLMIDHENKIFALGSFKGKSKRQNPKFKQIDATGYKSEISRVGIDYKCITNNLKY